jgi:hypothetical protein
MKKFYIPEYKTGFVTINKSGSLQIINTFKLFLDLKGIKYITDEPIGPDANVFILVRNPIDRFITSYNWFMVNENYNSVRTKYNITDIHMFLTHYKNIVTDINYDTHIAPQYFSLIDSLESDNKYILKQIKDRYKKYQFIHIEDVGDIHNTFLSSYNLINNFTESVNATEWKCILDLFNLPDISYKDKILFEMLYSFVKTHLDVNEHHKNSAKKHTDIASLKNDIMSYSYLNKELELYNYSK